MKDKKPVITRRDFIRGTIGVTVGTSILGLKWPIAEAKAARSSLVTVVRDKNAMDASKNVNNDILGKMLEQTLIKVTGQNNTKEAWLRLVKPNDRIGLVATENKNPTHEELIDVVESSLAAVGIPKNNINSLFKNYNGKKESLKRRAMATFSTTPLRGSR